MEREELISKKDLLLATGISYGQLYRWKRQRLLPDSWFMKMSSYTGQETYFPKRKVLERIRAILELKDAHSLDELADLFEPAAAGRTYSLLDAKDALGLDAAAFDACIRLWGKRSFTFPELLLIDVFAELERTGVLSRAEMEEGFAAAKLWTAESGAEAAAEGHATTAGSGTAAGGERRVVVFRKRGMAGFLLLEGAGAVRLDADSVPLGTFDLTLRTNGLQRKLTKAMEGWA